MENLNVSPKIPKWVTEPRVLTCQLESSWPTFVPTLVSLWPGPPCPRSLVRCAFLLIFVEWSILMSLEFCLMKSSCFLQRGANVLERWPFLKYADLGWLGPGSQGGPLMTVPPRVILSKGLDTRLARALWELSEVSYLKQLALTKRLVHFGAPLQIRWWKTDYLIACG